MYTSFDDYQFLDRPGDPGGHLRPALSWIRSSSLLR